MQPRGILVEVSIGFVFGNLLWAITGDLISHRLTYVIEGHGDVSPPHIAHQSRKNPEGTRLRIGHPTATTTTSQYAATFLRILDRKQVVIASELQRSRVRQEARAT